MVYLSVLNLALYWFCLVKRNEIPNQIALSRGFWVGATFALLSMEVVDRSSTCWAKMVRHAVVVCFEHIAPERPLLLTVFPIAQRYLPSLMYVQVSPIYGSRKGTGG